jgi:hypothetical protein
VDDVWPPARLGTWFGGLRGIRGPQETLASDDGAGRATGGFLHNAPSRTWLAHQSGLSPGEEALTMHFAMVDQAISLFARVWLPGADTSVDQQGRRPLRVDAAVDLDGNTSHWEVYF